MHRDCASPAQDAGVPCDIAHTLCQMPRSWPAHASSICGKVEATHGCSAHLGAVSALPIIRHHWRRKRTCSETHLPYHMLCRGPLVGTVLSGPVNAQRRSCLGPVLARPVVATLEVPVLRCK